MKISPAAASSWQPARPRLWPLPGSPLPANANPTPAKATSESPAESFYDSLTAEQRKQVCFGWDHVAETLGLLRTRISANWHVTEPVIESDFYTADQRRIIREIFLGLIQPDWVSRMDRQLKDDKGGFGKQSVAIFGTPGGGKFEFVLSGRHITLRCDGNSAEQVAFGGPIVYGHAARGFREKPGHPSNVFWPQAVAANSVVKMLDGKQQAKAVIDTPPRENAIAFQGRTGKLPGIAVKDLSADQKAHAQSVLAKLVEPYRPSDRDRVVACLEARKADSISAAWPSMNKANSVPANMSSRNWKARLSSGISAACRTYTRGSTWPMIRPCR